jgi:hypothetical protein
MIPLPSPGHRISLRYSRPGFESRQAIRFLGKTTALAQKFYLKNDSSADLPVAGTT